MRKAVTPIAILIILLIIYALQQPDTYQIREQVIIGNLSLRVLETKTDKIVVQHPITANEFQGGVFFSEGEEFEKLEATPGHDFFLVRLELRNLGEENLHLTGKEYKVLSAEDGEIYYPGVVSRKTRKASEEEFRYHHYPQLVTIQTLLPGQRIDGWIIFEIPEALGPKELRWYTDFQSRTPSFIIKF